MKKLFTIYLAAVLVGVLLTSTASATIFGTADLQSHNNSISHVGQIWGGGLNGKYLYTGIYSWTNVVANGTLLGTQVPDWGFCIELPQNSLNGMVDVIPLEEAPKPVLYGSPMAAIKANYIRELWGRFYNSSWEAGGTANKRMAEAFGVAIWEIIYETDTTWDVLTGAGFQALYIEQAAIANNWLSQLNGDTTKFETKLAAVSMDNGQDYLVLLPVTPPDVPEPATVGILSFGALCLIRRKKLV